jgi:hypothetical protein
LAKCSVQTKGFLASRQSVHGAQWRIYALN